jgi:hypothetical protein
MGRSARRYHAPMLWFLLFSCASSIPAPDTATASSASDDAGGGDAGGGDDGGGDDDGGDSDSPVEQITPGPLPAIVINEVQGDNDSTLMGPDWTTPDWVELFNDSGEPVALSRLALVDRGGQTWHGGEGELAPGAHLLLRTGVELDFGINDENEQLELFVDGYVVDRVALGEIASDTAWARYPDGDRWRFTARPTPGFTNGSHPGDGTDPTDALFDPAVVHDIQVTVSDAQWALLQADNYTEVVASMSWRGAFFPAVGLAKKSTVGSNRTLDQKAAFKLDLNEYEDHAIGGVQKLVLNNMVQDPTYVSEDSAYALFRAAGVPAPRVGYARLSINGVDWGLYALVEAVDDEFLARWFTQDDGAMFEGAYGVDFEWHEIDLFEYDQGPDPSDRAILEAVTAVLDGGPTDANVAALERLVDLDEFLSNMAVEVLILHWDGYTTANNYRLYHNPRTGRLSIIPWGTDQTFITLRYGLYGGYGRMMTFCMANAGCRARYEARVLEVADLEDALALDARVDAQRLRLAEEIATDPRAEHSAATQAQYVDITKATIRTWPNEVRAQLGAR